MSSLNLLLLMYIGIYLTGAFRVYINKLFYEIFYRKTKKVIYCFDNFNRTFIYIYIYIMILMEYMTDKSMC